MAVDNLQVLDIIEVMEAFLERKPPPEHISYTIKKMLLALSVFEYLLQFVVVPIRYFGIMLPGIEGRKSVLYSTTLN
jgi:hypothetical protein